MDFKEWWDDEKDLEYGPAGRCAAEWAWNAAMHFRDGELRETYGVRISKSKSDGISVIDDLRSLGE